MPGMYKVLCIKCIKYYTVFNYIVKTCITYQNGMVKCLE